ncbi:MAG: hypothetical protein EOP45_08170 [Sphingobacteriaceae bacterium]|nr:MAG: hypothetical protein EOP45_08170 [Sphingobacteriaceae bacterium]
MKLKIHTDLSLLDLGTPVDLLIPFIGISNEEYGEGRLYAHTFDEYCKYASDYIELVDIEECDVCLFPINYNQVWDAKDSRPAKIKNFIDKVEKSKKRIFIFLGHDISAISTNVNKAIVFSGAIDKSSQIENVYSYPHFFSDLLVYNSTAFTPKTKSELPVVGFCGYAPPLEIKFGKEKVIGILKLAANYAGLMKLFPSKISHSYRARALIALKNSNKLKLNLRIKNTFAFGPNGQLNTGGTKESDVDFRKNFINNILESDYTLCVRGIGNNSIRFFETLCCGRIPAFVNTDSVLPFDHIIDWRTKCLWIEEKDIDKIGDAVSKFHGTISADEYQKLQDELRSIWLEYLSPLGFYKNLRLFL